MLTCYGHTCRLPRGTLTYLAFRLSVLDALDEIQSYIDLEEDLDNVDGVLTYVPILRQVPAPVQIDLLAEVWSRQRPPKPIEANLLDAAIVYAICCNAGRIIREEPEIAELYLDGGPRKIKTDLTPETAERLEELFDLFWDDVDFLTLSDWQDLDGAHAAALKEVFRFADDQPLYEALGRGRVSPGLASNLKGLLTRREIRECLAVLRIR